MRSDDGEIVGTKPSEVSRITRHSLGSLFCGDRDRRLIVSLRDGDIIAVKPERLNGNSTLTITAQDLYGYLVRQQANRVALEKARESKAAKRSRKIAARIKRTEKRLVCEARKERGL